MTKNSLLQFWNRVLPRFLPTNGGNSFMMWRPILSLACRMDELKRKSPVNWEILLKWQRKR